MATPPRISLASLPLFGILTLSSLLSVAIFGLRVLYSGGFTYLFLTWNLILAWMPLLIGLLLQAAVRQRRSWTSPIFLFGLWLLFFPNAPYMITDLLHLGYWGEVPLWFDALMIFSFAWNGLMLGLVSLGMVHHAIRQRLGQGAGWLLVLAVSGASGFGIYLGRFARWNSWDLVTNPGALLTDILHILLDPGAHPRALAVTAFFAVFLLLAYLGMTAMSQIQTTSAQGFSKVTK